MDGLYVAGLDAGHLVRKPITLAPDSTVLEARDLMIKYNVSRIVVSRDGRAAGLLTEKDIARFLYKEVPARSLGEITLDEVMTRNPVTVGEDADLKSCAQTMLDRGISSLLVVDAKKKLKGIFTKSDLVDAYVQHYAGAHKVGKFMTEKVWTVSPDEPIHMAMLLMNMHRVSRIVVVRFGRPVGIITSRDLLPVGAVFGTGTVGSYWTARPDIIAKKRQQWFIPSGIKTAFVASDVMTRDPLVARVNDDLADAAYAMMRNRISGLPVVGRKNRLVGIVTKTDVIRALAA
ncbi:MAG: CBS domain-containing protein [Nitrososphaera sp.]